MSRARKTDAGRAFTLQGADDAFVIGHYLSSMTGRYGPDLEENLAIGSIAQDRLGHARAMYRTLVRSERAVDELVFLRDAHDFRSSSLADAWIVNDWAFLCIKGVLTSEFEAERCAAIVAVATGARPFAASIGRDVAVHVEHWNDWIARLAQTAEGRERLAAALRDLWPLLSDVSDVATWRDGGVALFGTPLDAQRAVTAAAQRAAATFAAARLPGAADLHPPEVPAEPSGGRAGRHEPAFVRELVSLQEVFRSAPEVQLT